MNTPMNSRDQQPATGHQAPSGWRGFILCYAAGVALLLVTTGLLKLAFAALG
jgi:hypothetical protein